MAQAIRFVVPDADDGLRLDQALARHVPGLSRRRARVLIDLGGVFVDRGRVKVAGRPVRAGQAVEANLGGALDRATGTGAAARARDDAELPAYRIVHEDEHLLVVDKPAGLVTAPTPESDRGNLLDLLSRRGAGPVYLVHRLDLPTSGLLVFARTAQANKVLGQRFSVHDVEREYTAVVAGAPPADLTTIDRPIRGQRAVTHLVGREPVAGATILTVRLETGRSHQIRIHLAAVGHPLLGDDTHGADVRHFEPRPPRLALHAGVLGFRHPADDRPVRWTSPPPPELAAWLDRLREVPVP
ncbi:MAG TPA: RluA family pseudouridine synthase [Kofleriaceae bacterium]|nr:RluA family pseudouridine synthase [Kofleriaceae bacterium]